MQDKFWVFGYGSLLWHPGFPVAETRKAVIRNWNRSFCMWSIHHRGTSEAPGLVLALDQQDGAICHGLALAVVPGQEEATLAYLRERELVSAAYIERYETLEFEDGAQAEALVYVVDPSHAQYTGGVILEEQAQIIAHAKGDRGLNRDYLWNTARHLSEIGIKDADLEWLAKRVTELTQGE